jgi:hypothetical protein
MAIFQDALKQKNKLSPILLQRSEIIGIGIGYADPKNPSMGAALHVYTRKKISQASIQNVKNICGREVPMRIIPSEDFKMHGAATIEKRRRTHNIVTKKKLDPNYSRFKIRPVPGGSGIGWIEGNRGAAGTAGLIIIKNGQLYFLSNNHVLIRVNRFAREIIQPAPQDGGTPSDRIGRSFQFVPYSLTGANYMDAAIGRPLSNRSLSPQYLISSTGNLITLRGHLLSYRVGDRFFKSGRTTGYTSGLVTSIHADLMVKTDFGPLLFRNQTVIQGSYPISQPGDSGSVWITSNGYAAALLFAGAGNLSVCTPIAWVLSTFGALVAVPAQTRYFKPGIAKGAAPKGDFSYVHPLRTPLRKQIQVLRAKKRMQ